MRIGSFLLAARLLSAVPRSATAKIIFDHYIVDTSAAFGVFTPPPGFGAPELLVFAGTPLSTLDENNLSLITDLPGAAGLVEAISGDPIFPSAFDGLLKTNYGALDNLEFLTSNLPQFGSAGNQLENAFQQRLATLQAAYPGVVFQAPAPSASFLSTESYGLFGGTLPDTPDPGDTVIITGTANVDFYSSNFTVTAVPEPSTLTLLGVGTCLLVCTARRRRMHTV